MHFFSTDFPNAGTTLNSSVVLIKENWTGLFPIRGLKYYLPNVGSFLLQAVHCSSSRSKKRNYCKSHFRLICGAHQRNNSTEALVSAGFVCNVPLRIRVGNSGKQKKSAAFRCRVVCQFDK